MDNSMNEGCPVYMITEAQLAKIVEMTVNKLTAGEQNEKRYFSTREICEQYGISATTLWRWQSANLIHPRRVGSHRRYDKEEIERILKK